MAEALMASPSSASDAQESAPVSKTGRLSKEEQGRIFRVVRYRGNVGPFQGPDPKYGRVGHRFSEFQFRFINPIPATDELGDAFPKDDKAACERYWDNLLERLLRPQGTRQQYKQSTGELEEVPLAPVLELVTGPEAVADPLPPNAKPPKPAPDQYAVSAQSVSKAMQPLVDSLKTVTEGLTAKSAGTAPGQIVISAADLDALVAKNVAEQLARIRADEAKAPQVVQGHQDRQQGQRK